MKITIYELLGMIKDDKAPKKIKVTGTIYDFDEEYGFYFAKQKDGRVALGGKLNEINLIYNFNSENNVEIIEEPQEHKIPEKIDLSDWVEITTPGDSEYKNFAKMFNKNSNTFANKINEILDYLEEENE